MRSPPPRHLKADPEEVVPEVELDDLDIPLF